MKNRKLQVAAVTLALMLIVLAFVSQSSPKLRPGSKAPTFSLKDQGGKEYSLEKAIENKLVVIMFISTQCPVSNAYNQRMVDLYDDYANEGVAFLAINSNAGNSPEEVQRHAKEHGFGFPVLKDNNNIVADAYDAQVTPETYVIDHSGILRYHGRIDDNPKGNNITSRDLRTALDALLSGMEVQHPETRAIGCGIGRVKMSSQ